MAVSEPRAVGSSLDDETALEVYRTMRRIRAAEDRIVRGIGAGEFRMVYYGVRGQEAIPAAVSAHLGPADAMVTTYRGMHDCIAKGVPLVELFAEMLGKATGTSKGKGGPMHLSDPQSGLMVTTGVVGGGLPIAVGLGLAAQLRGTDQVTVVNFGDGATSIGATHEAANLAALWQVPVVFVCQHNQYGEHTRFSDYTRTERLANRFATYGMTAETVDGNRVPDMYEAAGRAVARARSGGGPTFLECLTYRLGGHTFGAATDYMDVDELARAEEEEPVARCRQWLHDERGIDEKTLSDVDDGAVVEVEAAIEAAKSAPDPDEDELQTDVFADPAAIPA